MPGDDFLPARHIATARNPKGLPVISTSNQYQAFAERLQFAPTSDDDPPCDMGDVAHPMAAISNWFDRAASSIKDGNAIVEKWRKIAGNW